MAKNSIAMELLPIQLMQLPSFPPSYEYSYVNQLVLIGILAIVLINFTVWLVRIAVLATKFSMD